MFECIPNISEGRDESIIQAAEDSIKSVPGVKLLHIDIGYDANRTVYTFAGDALGIEQAVVRLYQICLSRIDLRSHVGAHPRLGAVDVCPIVPLQESSFSEAIEIANRIGSIVGQKFQIPVYLYEQSQQKSYRKNLSSIRRGQFEGLTDKLKLDEWRPDFGPNIHHPSFGATVIGARDFLIAFNISLDSGDLSLAKDIARCIRDYRGDTDLAVAKKWQAVRSIGWKMPKYGCVQVSTNLVDMNCVSLAEIFLEVKKLALAQGVEVLGSELIGLIPLKALADTAKGFGKNPDDHGMQFAIDTLNLSYHSKFDLDERILERVIPSANDF